MTNICHDKLVIAILETMQPFQQEARRDSNVFPTCGEEGASCPWWTIVGSVSFFQPLPQNSPDWPAFLNNLCNSIVSQVKYIFLKMSKKDFFIFFLLLFLSYFAFEHECQFASHNWKLCSCTAFHGALQTFNYLCWRRHCTQSPNLKNVWLLWMPLT